MSADTDARRPFGSDALATIGRLPDGELLARVRDLARRERQATAALVAHLAVLDHRRLYLQEGYSSLFTYCTQALRISENAAYWRIEAARAAQKFPLVLDRLADGSVHLTAVVLLAPHLTPANHRELLTAAMHKTKREVDELVAALRPRPPVPSAIRKRPELSLPSPSPADAARPGATPPGATPPYAPTGPTDTAPLRKGSVEPLAPQRYKVQFTASGELCAKLRRAQEMLRHQIPDGDLAQLIERAVTVLLERLDAQKYGATRGGARGHKTDPGGRRAGANSRYIPAAVRRAVYERDGGRCAFVSGSGRRCGERAFLEFHHVVPYSLGGEATVENIQLRCRAHNGFEAERCFGRRPPPGRRT